MKRVVNKGRILFWLTSTFLSRYKKHLLSGFISGFFIFLLTVKVSPIIALLFPSKQIVGIVGNYTPTTLPLSIQNLISFGLTKTSLEGETLPSLAVSWETKEEEKVYLFRLREDVFWHDGEKFTAQDVNYNLKGAEIRPLDQFTIEFRLKEPFSPLPSLLSQPIFKKGLIGTGIYKVSRLKLNVDRIDLISLTPVVQKRGASKLTFKFYPTESAAVTAFKLGEIDILQDLSDEYNFSSWKNVEIEKKVLSNQIITIFYNLRFSLLKEKDFRQAMNFAIPDLDEEKAWGPISPTSWAFSEKVKIYKFDLEKGKKLLNEEDLATNAASLTLSTFPSFLSLAQKIANSWEKLGVEILVRVENTIPENFEALLTIQQIPPDPDQYALWHSTQERTNISNLKDPKIDKLLEDGRKTFKKEERKLIYADFQKYLMDEAPAAFLYYPTVYTISRK